ncbi:hypothetical protein [Streptomyces sp. NBC_01462]|uniref:hypothetical protein n=1 Tax=Streptomyces sp. NBC_01462 TaxID=2903876 RepID=UPI002E331B7E|nr:hypothetical protein [Streptomyces sp. NBC_01462]
MPPPEPAPKKGSNVAGFGCLGVLAFIILIVIIGSTSDSDDKQDSKNESRANAPARATEHTKAKASPGIDKHTITKMAVNLTWQNYSEQRRDAACLLDDSLYEYEGGGWRHSRWT